MTHLNDGGPAFGHGNPEQGGSEGMSLRDWFAGQAMSGMCGHPSGLASVSDGDLAADAQLSYRIADAMLEARKVKP